MDPRESKVPPPVPGRECGDCNVCCVVLRINDPELQKPAGVRCANALPDNRCGIYGTRPSVCRGFLCGWRQLRWVRPGLRPDVSGILIRPRPTDIEGMQPVGLIFTVLRDGALQSEGVAETMAAAVAANVPVFFQVTGHGGQGQASAMINELLSGPVRDRDKPAMVAMLLGLWEGACQVVEEGLLPPPPELEAPQPAPP